MTILKTTHYATIRAALDVSLDSDMLPDDTISMSIYAGAAEAEVIARDPDAATRTGDELTHIQNAIILITAALLAPAVPHIMEARQDQQSYKRNQIDWAVRAAELRRQADVEIAAVLEPSEATPGRPTMFATAAGTRGK